METKRPQAGEWWRTRGGEIRYVVAEVSGIVRHCEYPILTINHNGSMAPKSAAGLNFQNHCGSYDLVEPLPDCTGFDWVPETFPQYWTTIDSLTSSVAFVKRTSSSKYVAVKKDGSDGPGAHWTPNDQAYRKQLTEAEALALLNQTEPVEKCIVCGCESIAGTDGCKECTERAIACVNGPVESPDDWVVQDRVPARKSTDEVRWIKDNQDPGDFGPCDFTSGMKHGVRINEFTLEVRCRRKDLPPLPDAAPQDKRSNVAQKTIERIKRFDPSSIAAPQPQWQTIEICGRKYEIREAQTH